MLSKQEIIRLLNDNPQDSGLYQKADAVRQQYVGSDIHIRALLEFSNICKNNCLYCGIRAGNASVLRYRLDDNDFIATAKHAADIGFKTIVMQSGEDMYFTADRLCKIIESIKKFDVAVTLSIGERSYQDYKAFRNAGADRYLMRIETTDKDLYHKLDPNMDWQHRYECLLALKELGYELGSGIMVGLPEQSIESIADDLLFLQKLGVDMAGIGPFIPHPQTPLKSCEGGSLELSLKTMAVMRLLLPDINIPATTAMETLHPPGRIKALQCGANVVMLNVTSEKQRQNYELYPKKDAYSDLPEKVFADMKQKITDLGRTFGSGYGGHTKRQR